jgi:predicted nucleic acid-binding protein
MKAAGSKRFVLDASIALAWCFADEARRFTERVVDLVTDADEVFVPALWPFELCNGLLGAERRKRITPAQSLAFLNRITLLPISIDPPQTSRIFDDILSAARQHILTAYDAAYLEVAVRRAIPLASLDKELRRAAVAVGVDLIS